MEKYGQYEGPQNPDKMFEVNLIPNLGSEVTKTFRLRGVAKAYEQFDRPERCDPAILHHAQLLERAFVTPIYFPSPNGNSGDTDGMVLRYVKISEAEKKARSRLKLAMVADPRLFLGVSRG